ncbi:MAG: archaeosine biosynthesis radical SAM protein RaSEA [Thermoplasmatota archaeon]
MSEVSQKDLGRPLSVWKETDSIDGNKVDVLVMILKTSGCSWASRTGCTMCGYNVVTFPDITAENIVAQVNSALERYNGEPYIKIFTSGSFLDPGEVPVKALDEMIKRISEKAPLVRLLIESRPEFITEKSLKPFIERNGPTEIAIGLETSSDWIRGSYIRKGFTWQDYIEGGRTVIQNGLHLKTYLLLKPPFLGESDAIRDCLGSIEEVHSQFPGSRISINPMNIQSQTLVEHLYSKRAYRPPWLWSLLEVLMEGYEITKGLTHLMSSPTAGGKKRGVHNCGKCDETVLEAIGRFSLKNDPAYLQNLDHTCKEEWKEYRMGSLLDPILRGK